MSKILTDEELKAKLTGGADAARNNQAFESTGTVDNRPALRYFHRPTSSDLEAMSDPIGRLLRGGGHVIIPMREHRAVIGNVLAYLADKVDLHKVMVVNCNSTDDALTAVAPFEDRGVHLVHHNEVLDWLDWDKLLPVMAMDKRPAEGKGITMLAGMLAAHQLWPNARAIVQHDADVRECAKYDSMTHLAFPLTQLNGSGTRLLGVKMSRAGRGNEIPMVARNILRDMASNPYLPENIREVAIHLSEVLTEHKWMLTGEFGIFGRVAYHRPFATGYLEETLISIFLESCIRYRNGDHGSKPEAIAQVEPVYNRFDDFNDERKELRMMDRIARFLVEYSFFGKPITSWALDDYQRFNTRFGTLTTVARIPSPMDEQDQPGRMGGPVVIENLVQDRIIPSVCALKKGGFIDHAKAEAWVARHRR